MSDRPTMPMSLRDEAEYQRARRVRDLERQIAVLSACAPNDWAFEFSADCVSPPNFGRAVRAAMRLDSANDCDATSLRAVRFRPDPHKYEGAWLVQVTFAHHTGMSAKEWHVSENELFQAWWEPGDR
jgi:hypothetical protein